jgi:hypothetical protein
MNRNSLNKNTLELTSNIPYFIYNDIKEELTDLGIDPCEYINIYDKVLNDLNRHIYRTTRHIIRENNISVQNLLKKECFDAIFSGIKTVIEKFYKDTYGTSEHIDIIYPDAKYWECICDELITKMSSRHLVE